ncbi:MAG: anti-sigma F factor [Firmicutes bacterium]|nr:anti-sigma F factor [Bacillota bacterium]
MENTMQLKIKALSENEAFARSVVSAFCVPLNPTVEELNDIKTAVSEAVTNAIVHGYEYDANGEIEITVALKDNSVHIEVIDNGVGILDIEKAKEPFFTTKPDDERSGMGFSVMESFMDSLEVESVKGVGVVVRMSKNFDMTEGTEA